MTLPARELVVTHLGRPHVVLVYTDALPGDDGVDLGADVLVYALPWRPGNPPVAVGYRGRGGWRRHSGARDVWATAVGALNP